MTIQRVAVFGAGGMLGRAMAEELRLRGLAVLALTHELCDIADEAAVEHAFGTGIKFEAAINCAGTRPGTKPAAMARANTVGPHVLAAHAFAGNLQHLVHVSTDCVFNGQPQDLPRAIWSINSIGPEPAPARYSIGDQVTPADLYGRTKAAGELIGVPRATTVRTSFIGPDHGLLRFLMDAETAGKTTIHGWRCAFWSGSTVWAVARGLADILMKLPSGAVEHLATETPISKADALETVRQAFGFRVGILPVDRPAINRSLEPTVTLAPLSHGLRELAERCGIPARAG